MCFRLGIRVSKIGKFCRILQNFWRARSRLYKNEILQENMRLTAFFNLYKMCTLLHRSKLKILAKIRFEFSAIFIKNPAKYLRMLQYLRNFATILKFRLDNLVDLKKCCKTRIYLQRSVPIQPKTSNILPKFCQKLATTLHAL